MIKITYPWTVQRAGKQGKHSTKQGRHKKGSEKGGWFAPKEFSGQEPAVVESAKEHFNIWNSSRKALARAKKRGAFADEIEAREDIVKVNKRKFLREKVKAMGAGYKVNNLGKWSNEAQMEKDAAPDSGYVPPNKRPVPAGGEKELDYLQSDMYAMGLKSNIHPDRMPTYKSLEKQGFVTLTERTDDYTGIKKTTSALTDKGKAAVGIGKMPERIKKMSDRELVAYDQETEEEINTHFNNTKDNVRNVSGGLNPKHDTSDSYKSVADSYNAKEEIRSRRAGWVKKGSDAVEDTLKKYKDMSKKELEKEFGMKKNQKVKVQTGEGLKEIEVDVIGDVALPPIKSRSITMPFHTRTGMTLAPDVPPGTKGAKNRKNMMLYAKAVNEGIDLDFDYGGVDLRSIGVRRPGKLENRIRGDRNLLGSNVRGIVQAWEDEFGEFGYD